MVKRFIWQNNILKALENMSNTDKNVNHKELFEEVRTILNKDPDIYISKNKRSLKKSFNTALASLLNKEKIMITGYDFRVHTTNNKNGSSDTMSITKIQAFKIEGLCFNLFKTEQTHVLALLNELETLNSTSKARQELQNLFERKFKEYKSLRKEYKDNLKKKIEVISIREKIKELEDFLEQKGRPHIIQPETETQVGLSIGAQTGYQVKMLDLYKGWYNKYPEAKVWRIKKLEKRDMPAELVAVGKYWVYSLNHENKVVANEETFLNYLGAEYPITKTSEDLRKLLAGILFYINSHLKEKFLKNSFSYALSDEKDSLDWFEYFIMNINSITKLKEETRVLVVNEGYNENRKLKQEILEHIIDINRPLI